MGTYRNAVWAFVLGVPLLQVGACGGSGGSGPLVPGRLSIPAAAFRPRKGTDLYQQAGAYVLGLVDASASPDAEPPTTGACFAPVHLPDGATPTRFAMTFRDGGPGVVVATFARTRYVTGPSTQILASVTSFDSFAPANAGEESTSTFTLSQIATDNQRYMYWIQVDRITTGVASPDGLPAICAIEIDYVVPENPPTIRYHGVCAADFGPRSGQQDWVDVGERFHNEAGYPDPDGEGRYLAPVRLPDGATLEDLTFHWKVEPGQVPSPATATVRFHRSLHADATHEELVAVTSQPAVGEGLATVVPSSPVGIDNATYAYWLTADLPSPYGDRVSLMSVVFAYSAPSSATDRVALPAAAFQPSDGSLEYENEGRRLVHTGIEGAFPGPGLEGTYFAGLELPDGATVTNLTFFWDAETVAPGTARLQRTLRSQAGIQTMATASTGVGGTGNGSTSVTSIANATIDNAAYAYWVSWEVPAYQPALDEAVRGHSVVVEWTK